jgi:hypothetical protein
VLAVGVVLLGEGVEGPDPLERLGDEAGALVMDAAGDDYAPALSAGAEGGLFAKKLASILIFYGYTRRSQRHIPSEGMSGISIED